MDDPVGELHLDYTGRAGCIVSSLLKCKAGVRAEKTVEFFV